MRTWEAASTTRYDDGKPGDDEGNQYTTCYWRTFRCKICACSEAAGQKGW